MRTMSGEPVVMQNGKLHIPNNPIIHYIEGDGIGVDISPVMISVVDAAVSKAYNGEKQIAWNEVLAGEKAFNATGEWLPEATLDAMRSGLVSIKGHSLPQSAVEFVRSMSLFDKNWTSSLVFVQFDGTMVHHLRSKRPVMLT